MELFAEIVNGLKALTISAKSSILDVGLGSEYASVSEVAFSVVPQNKSSNNCSYNCKSVTILNKY